MKNIISLLILFTQLSFAQKNLKIKYTYAKLYIDSDTITIQRVPQSELERLGKKYLNLPFKFQKLEQTLNERSKGFKPAYEYNRSNEIENILVNIKQFFLDNNAKSDLTNYYNELEFLKKHPVKSDKEKKDEQLAKQQKQVEEKYILELEKVAAENRQHQIIQHRNDSIDIAEKRIRAKQDSISDAEYLANQKTQEIQHEAHRKKNTEQSKQNKVESVQKDLERKQANITRYGESNGTLINNHQVKIGWSKDMCIASWGKPKSVNTTTTENLKSEQWVYSMKKYLYFDNGILKAIQN